jgi:uncharacterized DUF497 family protein
MQEILFEWDERKNRANIKKHGISFQEAKTCFEDDFAEMFPDTEHSENENRYIFLGLSEVLRTLVVIYTERNIEENEKIVNRIISARKATKKEFLYYWEHRRQKEQK